MYYMDLSISLQSRDDAAVLEVQARGQTKLRLVERCLSEVEIRRGITWFGSIGASAAAHHFLLCFWF